MTDYAIGTGRRASRRKRHLGRAVRAILVLGVTGVAAAPIAYMMTPRWTPPVAQDAPSMPITVGGVTFNVPPAAIRVPMQRRPGAQARIDIVFLWPALTPPDLSAKPSASKPPDLSERIFVTVSAADGSLPPAERLTAIYPRYIDPPAAGPDGLVTAAFRPGTPYQGEDLIHSRDAAESFALRCTRTAGRAPGTCLHQRRIAGADVTVRFPRDWLSDWRTVSEGIERMVASLRPSGG